MLQKIIFLLVLTCGFQSKAFAQDTIAANTSTVYPSFQSKKYKILLHTQELLVAKSLDSLRGNTLYITGKQGPQEVSLELISKLLVAKKKRPVLKGLAFGALGGAAIGALVGYTTYEESDPGSWFATTRSFDTAAAAFGFGLIGALTGVVIGAVSYKYNRHNLSNLPHNEKHALLSRILSGK
jgi:hypothetical protein